MLSESQTKAFGKSKQTAKTRFSKMGFGYVREEGGHH